jgi:hypothetical protein
LKRGFDRRLVNAPAIDAARRATHGGRTLGTTKGWASGMALLWVSIILCTVIGMMKREPPFGMVLNHWDETVAYAALFYLVSSFNHSVPV